MLKIYKQKENVFTEKKHLQMYTNHSNSVYKENQNKQKENMAAKVMIFIDISFLQCIQFIMSNRDGPEYVLSHRVSVFHDHLTSGVDNSNNNTT